jgi:hypothetical protein
MKANTNYLDLAACLTLRQYLPSRQLITRAVTPNCLENLMDDTLSELEIYPFKDQIYVFYIRIRVVSRSKHSLLLL